MEKRGKQVYNKFKMGGSQNGGSDFRYPYLGSSADDADISLQYT
jgi:hypothetical protein